MPVQLSAEVVVAEAHWTGDNLRILRPRIQNHPQMFRCPRSCTSSLSKCGDLGLWLRSGVPILWGDESKFRCIVLDNLMVPESSGRAHQSGAQSQWGREIVRELVRCRASAPHLGDIYLTSGLYSGEDGIIIA